MKITFDTKGNDKQKLAAKYWIDKSTEKILYGGAKYGGKSYLGVNLTFGDAFLYPETRYFIARESLTDLRRYTIPSIFEVIQDWGLNPDSYINFNGQDSVFNVYNGSKVFLIDAKYLPRDPDFHRFGSIQMTRGWCEEIGQMHPLAIDNLWLSIGRWNNQKYGLKKKMLMTCNPHKGYGYINFYKPNKEGVLTNDKKFIISLPRDNKAGDKDYIRSIEENPNEAERERLGFGNWEFDNDKNTLIDYNNILNLFTNEYVYDENEQKFITADIATGGADKFVMFVWKGLTIIDYKIVKKCKPHEVISILRELCVMWKVPASNIIYDADGVGAVVDVWFQQALEIKNGRRPIGKANYPNLKTQLEYLLAEYIQNNKIYIKCELPSNVKNDLIQELEQLKRHNSDSDGKLQTTPKVKLKENIGGRSPDLMDSMKFRLFAILKGIG